jgi:hypothetical protein
MSSDDEELAALRAARVARGGGLTVVRKREREREGERERDKETSSMLAVETSVAFSRPHLHSPPSIFHSN